MPSEQLCRPARLKLLTTKWWDGHCAILRAGFDAVRHSRVSCGRRLRTGSPAPVEDWATLVRGRCCPSVFDPRLIWIGRGGRRLGGVEWWVEVRRTHGVDGLSASDPLAGTRVIASVIAPLLDGRTGRISLSLKRSVTGLSVGVVGTSRKPDGRRLPIHPARLWAYWRRFAPPGVLRARRRSSLRGGG